MGVTRDLSYDAIISFCQKNRNTDKIVKKVSKDDLLARLNVRTNCSIVSLTAGGADRSLFGNW